MKGSFGVCYEVEELESQLDCCVGLSLGLGSDKSLSISLSMGALFFPFLDADRLKDMTNSW